MGVTRTDLFSAEQNEMAQIAKVLGHPARIAILQHLIKMNSCINSDLVEELGLAQATISQHLRELKEIGIIQGSIEGVSINYCIDAQKWDSFRLIFHNLFETINQASSTSCCTPIK